MGSTVQEFQLACLAGRQSVRRIQLTEQTMSIHLPILRSPIEVPMSDVLGVGRRIDWANDESVIHRPPVVPTVATGTNMESPNVAIVFRTPQRIPPLAFGAGTAVGLSRRASRSSDGLFIDAVQLKAKDVDAFIAAAAERGIITADNVAGALLQAIGTVIDHEEASTKRAQTDRQTRKVFLAMILPIIDIACFVGAIGSELVVDP